jgi:hypothetical protein
MGTDLIDWSFSCTPQRKENLDKDGNIYNDVDSCLTSGAIIMEDDTYELYKVGMVNLLKSPEPVESSDENLEILFPHLLLSETRAALNEGKFIAAPPLMRHGTFHVVGSVSGSDERLSYQGCFSQKQHNAGNIKYVKRAGDFSRIHFKKHYFLGEYQFVLNVILRRFGSLNGGIKALWLLVDEDLAVIVGSTKKQRSRLIDSATVFKTVNPVKGREAAALREMKVVYNCASCGSPLRDKGCGVCLEKEIDCYPDFNMGPLPVGAIDYLLKKGHKFAKDPLIALEREKNRVESVPRETRIAKNGKSSTSCS